MCPPIRSRLASNLIPVGRRLWFGALIWTASVGFYLWLLSTNAGTQLAAAAADQITTTADRSTAQLVFGVMLTISLMLPFSPASVLVLLGVQIFGPATTFLISFAAGVTSSTLAYWIGRWLGMALPSRPTAAVQQLDTYIRRGTLVWWVVFVVRAVPNPLYDAWGYAAGILRLSYVSYLTASALGGSIPLAILCAAGAL